MHWQKHIQVWFAIFAILFTASFSFPFNVIPNIGGWLEPFFNALTRVIGSVFLDASAEALTYHSGEDALGMLVNTINIVLISAISYLGAFIFWKQKLFVLLPYLRIYFRYYLALMLLIYGFDKVYKYQFYYPEPNILFTQFKDIPQDLRYWSTMGTSYSYSLFAGLIEVIPGVLLLWRRTYVLGAMIALFVFVNVFMINVGFDITIKLFSFFLLVMCVILLLPQSKRLWLIFTGKKSELKSIENPLIYSKPYYLFLKIVVLLIFCYESQHKLIASGKFNDDRAKRPELHGAYKVLDADRIESNWKMIYFHRQGYFIVEDLNEVFYDFKLNVDKESHLLQLTTYEMEKMSLQYEAKSDTLIIRDVESGFKVKAVKVYSYE